MRPVDELDEVVGVELGGDGMFVVHDDGEGVLNVGDVPDDLIDEMLPCLALFGDAGDGWHHRC